MTDSNVFYPIEAFALAMVLYTGGMREAMMAGIGLIAGDVLFHVLHENYKDKYRRAFGGLGLFVIVAVFIYCWNRTGLPVDVNTLLGFGAMATLLGKYHDDLKMPTPDYNKILWGDSVAYGFLVLLAAVREFVSGGSIYAVELTKWGIMSHAFASPMFSLIFAGIILAFVNGVLKVECKKDAALWVCIPTILLETPFVLNNVPEWLGTIIGVLFMLIIYYTFRKKITRPAVSKSLRGIPVELVALGMLYMIFSIL